MVADMLSLDVRGKQQQRRPPQRSVASGPVPRLATSLPSPAPGPEARRPGTGLGIDPDENGERLRQPLRHEHQRQHAPRGRRGQRRADRGHRRWPEGRRDRPDRPARRAHLPAAADPRGPGGGAGHRRRRGGRGRRRARGRGDLAGAPRPRASPGARVDVVPASPRAVVSAVARHLRPRGDGIAQPVTTVELFFDLVYVFAITQLSHLILADLSVAGVARAAFLLLIVWWAWIYTTWMVNWFDPASPTVRGVLTGVMLVSLLMSAALPGAFGADGVLFAASYVALQVGRNVAAATMLRRREPLRDIFERLVGWSVASGALWLVGAALPGDRRLLLWIPAVVLDLCAPVAGYWLPGRGRAATTDYDIEGGHFTDRCQGFIIIALGESIVITGATAADAGLSATVVVCLAVAFLQTAALWWLYFGAAADRARDLMRTREDPGRLARDAYTYMHLPIVAGIIAAAVGDDLLIADPARALHGVGLAMVLGGPVLFLVGESLFRLRVTGAANAERLAVAAILVLLAPLGSQMSALALSASVAALLSGLALWELRTLARHSLSGQLRHLQPQQEGTP